MKNLLFEKNSGPKKLKNTNETLKDFTERFISLKIFRIYAWNQGFVQISL